MSCFAIVLLCFNLLIGVLLLMSSCLGWLIDYSDQIKLAACHVYEGGVLCVYKFEVSFVACTIVAYASESKNSVERGSALGKG